MNTRSAQAAGSGSGSNKVVFLTALGLLVTIVLTILTFLHVSRSDDNEDQYLLRAAEQRVMSQQIAKFALAAASGDQAAFARLREYRDTFQRLIGELKNGIPALNLPPVPTEVGVQLKATENAWLELRQNADDILTSEQAIVSVREYISIITNLVPELQKLSQQVVDILVDGQSTKQLGPHGTTNVGRANRQERSQGFCRWAGYRGGYRSVQQRCRPFWPGAGRHA